MARECRSSGRDWKGLEGKMALHSILIENGARGAAVLGSRQVNGLVVEHNPNSGF